MTMMMMLLLMISHNDDSNKQHELFCDQSIINQ